MPPGQSSGAHLGPHPYCSVTAPTANPRGHTEDVSQRVQKEGRDTGMPECSGGSTSQLALSPHGTQAGPEPWGQHLTPTVPLLMSSRNSAPSHCSH